MCVFQTNEEKTSEIIKHPLILIALLQPRLVAGLPNFGQRNGRMEPVENAQGQGDTLHDGPRQESVELELHRIRLHLLCLERVDDPHGHVADEEEGDHLPARLGAVVFRQVDAAARHIRYEQQLENHLGENN